MSELTTAQYLHHTGTAWQSGNEFRVFGIQYDRDGKITWKHVQNGSSAEELYMVYAYAAGTNRITFIDEYINQVGTPITYDANANMTAIGAPVGLSSGVYDRRNLLVSASSGGQNLNWRYDHQGLLVYRQEAGDHILTLRGAFGEPLAVYRNGALDQWNLLRPDGTVIGRRESGGTRKYYHRDLLGSTRTVVDASGTVTETWDYMPYGEIMTGRGNPQAATRQTYTAHEFENETGMYNMHWRRYIPRFGVFTSVDPMADDAMQVHLTPYNYSWNNPVSNTDPDGRCPWCVGALLGGGVELASQIAINMSSGQSFAEAMSNVDVLDVVVATGAGALTGGLSTVRSLGTVAKTGISVTTNIAEGAAKATLGTQATEYGITDFSKDAVLGFAGSAGSAAGSRIASRTSTGQSLQNRASTLERRAGNKAGNLNTAKGRAAHQARQRANRYEASRGVAAGTATQATGGGVINIMIPDNSATTQTSRVQNTHTRAVTPADKTRVVLPEIRDID
ncbi:MAG: RHS repeat-associated core domain-containing protein [Cyclonatronaceae bacterium]